MKAWRGIGIGVVLSLFPIVCPAATLYVDLNSTNPVSPVTDPAAIGTQPVFYRVGVQ